MKVALLLSMLVWSFQVSATNYYVSASGNDNNSGTSTSTPWQTLNKLNSAFSSFKAGDNIYLNRGDVFYGSIIVTKSGSAGSPITIGAYGSGDKPVVTGFTTINSWSSLGSNIWESSSAVSTLARTRMVFSGGRYAQMGRYPNSGWLTYQSQNVTGNNSSQSPENVTITSDNIVGNWTGAEIFIYANRYSFDQCTIASQSGGTITYASINKPVYEKKTPKFIIQNDPRTLDTQNEWYYNPKTYKLQIYSSGTPQNIQISNIENLVSNNGYSYLTFDNLSFLGSNGNAIQLTNTSYVSIQNCDIDFSGRDAINGGGGNSALGVVLQNCSINHSNNSSIVLNSNFDGAVIRSNNIKNTAWKQGMSAMNAFGIDAKGKNNLVSYNSLDSSAYIGIQYFGDGTTVSNNFITNFDVYLTDGGGIYTWNGWGGAVKSNLKVINNIIINRHTDIGDVGIYLDDWSNNIEVSGNTVAGCGSGMSAGNAFNAKFKNNTSFDNNMSQIFLLRSSTQPVAGKKGLDYLEVTGNIFFVKVPVTNGVGSHSMFIMDAASGSGLPTNSTFDYNYYVSPVYTKGSIYSYFNSVAADRYISSWQNYSGQDAHSKETPMVIPDSTYLRFEYNPSTSNKTVSLGASYMDAKGTIYNGVITLSPYSSAVLIKSGPATYEPPTASAGANQTITLPNNSVNVSGNGTAPGGSISSYSWTQSSGPSTAVIANTNSASTNITGLAQGTYVFQLKVTDNKGTTAVSPVQISVNAAMGTSAPSADAGEDQAFSLPLSSISLNGSGSVSGGTVSSYSWTQLSGPAGVRITSPNSPSTTVTGLAVGAYQFQLSVTDNNGKTALSSVTISVSAAGGANLLPAVNPGYTVNGLNYNYYEEVGKYGSVPPFASINPVKSGTTNTFDITLAQKSQVFAFNFTGFINVPSDGQYTFYTNSDDGSLLYIDNILVVDNDGLHNVAEKSGTIGLKAGLHAITVGYLQMGGGATLNVNYAGPSLSKQIIPASALYVVSADDLLPAVNPGSTINGVNYSYYEAVSNNNTVPNFDAISPVKKGTATNFDITLANRSQVFAFNFTGFINIPSDGQYTFYTNSDDGSLLYIDNILVVNNDGLHNVAERSGKIGLKAGLHAITVGYLQMGGGSTLNVSYAGPSVSKQVIPSSLLFISAADGYFPAVNPGSTINGVNYSYYEAVSNNNAVPSFTSISPVKKGTTTNFDITLANRSQVFAFNFTGYINVPTDGRYTFYTNSDDGSLLYIDNMLVVNNDGLHNLAEKSGTIGLKAGLHAITVGYLQMGGGATLNVSYAGPSVSKQLIPGSVLYRVSGSQRSGLNQLSGLSGAQSSTNQLIGDQSLTNQEMQVGVKAYPNPFANTIVVNITGEAGDYKLIMVDALGRTLWLKSGNKAAGSTQQSINVSSLQKGIYFLKVYQNNNVSEIKLVK